MKTPRVNLKVLVSGHYKLEAVRPDGSKRLLADWFENLITDSGLNRMGTGSYFDWCQVGTGSTAAANSDTALVARVGGSSTLQTSSNGCAASAPYYGYQSKTFRFVAGTATGNLAEVGIGWASTGSLFSRALIKDGGGSPTTVTVLAGEILDVTYELRTYAPVADSSSFDLTISSTVYSFVVRAALVTTPQNWAPQNVAVGHYNPGSFTYQSGYSGAIAAVTAAPSGTQKTPTNVTNAAYSNNSLQRDFTVFWDLNDGNVGGGVGLTALLAGTTIGTFQLSVSPQLLKTNVKQLTLNYRVSWARHP